MTTGRKSNAKRVKQQLLLNKLLTFKLKRTPDENEDSDRNDELGAFSLGSESDSSSHNQSTVTVPIVIPDEEEDLVWSEDEEKTTLRNNLTLSQEQQSPTNQKPVVTYQLICTSRNNKRPNISLLNLTKMAPSELNFDELIDGLLYFGAFTFILDKLRVAELTNLSLSYPVLDRAIQYATAHKLIQIIPNLKHQFLKLDPELITSTPIINLLRYFTLTQNDMDLKAIMEIKKQSTVTLTSSELQTIWEEAIYKSKFATEALYSISITDTIAIDTELFVDHIITAFLEYDLSSSIMDLIDRLHLANKAKCISFDSVQVLLDYFLDNAQWENASKVYVIASRFKYPINRITEELLIRSMIESCDNAEIVYDVNYFLLFTNLNSI